MPTIPTDDFIYIGRVPGLTSETVTWDAVFTPQSGFPDLPPLVIPYLNSRVMVSASTEDESVERNPVSPGVLTLTPTVTNRNGHAVTLEPLTLTISLI
jgi:hypothetical protein